MSNLIKLKRVEFSELIPRCYLRLPDVTSSSGQFLDDSDRLHESLRKEFSFQYGRHVRQYGYATLDIKHDY